MKKKLIFILSLIVLSNIFFSPLLSMPKFAKAADQSFSNDNIVHQNALTQIEHDFKISGTPHKVTYTLDSSLKQNAEAGGGVTNFYYQMTDSDYFSVDDSFFLTNSSISTATQVGPEGYSVWEEIQKSDYDSETKNKVTGAQIVLQTISGRYFRQVVKNYEDGRSYWTIMLGLGQDESGVSDYARSYINHISDSGFAPTETDLQTNLNNYFTSGATYNVTVKDNGDSAPTITVSGSAQTTNARPTTTYKLTGVGGWSGILSSEQNNFYFTYVPQNNTYDATFQHVALKITQQGDGSFVSKPDTSQLDDQPLNGTVQVDATSWLNIINKVYNAKDPSGTNVCGNATIYNKTANPAYTQDDLSSSKYRQCINDDTTGWLNKWGVQFVKASLSNPSGGTSNDICGLPTTASSWIGAFFTGKTGFGDAVRMIFCEMDLLIYQFAEAFVAGAVNAFNQAVGLH